MPSPGSLLILAPYPAHAAAPPLVEHCIRELARTILATHAYRVIAAKDGAEAVTIYRERRGEIALVLLDLMMPVLDGSKAIRASRQLDPNVPGLVEPAALLQKTYPAQMRLQMVQGALR